MTATSSLRNDPNGRKPVARLYDWQGQDRAGRPVCGQMRADLPEQVEARLLRQGITGTVSYTHLTLPTILLV